MAKVGVNNEPLHERLIFGYDGSDYRVCKVDGEGNLVVALKANQEIVARNYGYVGGAWQKNPVPIGYSGDWTEELQDLTAATGTNTLSGTTVPAGEIWLLYMIGAQDSTSAPSRIEVTCSVNGYTVPYIDDGSPVMAGWSFDYRQIMLSEDDFLRVVFYGCTLNDDLYVRYHALRIDIDL